MTTRSETSHALPPSDGSCAVSISGHNDAEPSSITTTPCPEGIVGPSSQENDAKKTNNNNYVDTIIAESKDETDTQDHEAVIKEEHDEIESKPEEEKTTITTTINHYSPPSKSANSKNSAQEPSENNHDRSSNISVPNDGDTEERDAEDQGQDDEPEINAKKYSDENPIVAENAPRNEDQRSKGGTPQVVEVVGDAIASASSINKNVKEENSHTFMEKDGGITDHPLETNTQDVFKVGTNERVQGLHKDPAVEIDDLHLQEGSETNTTNNTAATNEKRGSESAKRAVNSDVKSKDGTLQIACSTSNSNSQSSSSSRRGTQTKQSAVYPVKGNANRPVSPPEKEGTIIGESTKCNNTKKVNEPVENRFHLDKKYKDYPMKGIHVPHNNDVLFDKHISPSQHPGNQLYQRQIQFFMLEFSQASTWVKKGRVARQIVTSLRKCNPPTRFLERDEDTGLWFDIGEECAIMAAARALKEEFSKVGRGRSREKRNREDIDGGGDGYDADADDGDGGKNEEENNMQIISGNQNVLGQNRSYVVMFPMDADVRLDDLDSVNQGTTTFHDAFNLFEKHFVRAKNLFEKGKVAVGIIALVKRLSPGTRFLVKDPASPYWKSLTDEAVIAEVALVIGFFSREKWLIKDDSNDQKTPEDERIADAEWNEYPKNDIKSPHENDVLLGRGGLTKKHPGNCLFRVLIDKFKPKYVVLNRKIEKHFTASAIVAAVRNRCPPGRFLQKDGKDGNGNWNDVGDERAVGKALQALRENQPEVRKNIMVKGSKAKTDRGNDRTYATADATVESGSGPGSFKGNFQYPLRFGAQSSLPHPMAGPRQLPPSYHSDYFVHSEMTMRSFVPPNHARIQNPRPSFAPVPPGNNPIPRTPNFPPNFLVPGRRGYNQATFKSPMPPTFSQMPDSAGSLHPSNFNPTPIRQSPAIPSNYYARPPANLAFGRSYDPKYVFYGNAPPPKRQKPTIPKKRNT